MNQNVPPQAPGSGDHGRGRMVHAQQVNTEIRTLSEFMNVIRDGAVYCRAHLGVLSLMCLEAAIWTVGSAILLFLVFHAAQALQQNSGLLFPGRVLEFAGLGLLCGMWFMKKKHREISPILCYAPAWLLLAFGLNGVMNSTDGAGWAITALLALGLGFGLFAARTGTDVESAVEPDKRARVGVLKSALRAAMVLTMIALEASLSAVQFEDFMSWMPGVLYLALPLVFVLSWLSDIATHARNEVSAVREFPGPLHRLGYRSLRAIARWLLKPLFKYEAVDAKNVPEAGGVVIAANHGSFLDPILLSCGTDRLIQYVIYSSYYRSLAHPLFRFLRCIPVDEHDQLGALRAGVRSLKLGACIGIFPEGEVSADGKLRPPMRGALFLAQRSGASVVPAALKGDSQALPRGAWVPRKTKVTPIFGKPFFVDKELSKEQTEELTDSLMADLAKKLDLEPPPATKHEEKPESETEKSTMSAQKTTASPTVSPPSARVPRD